MACKRLCTSAYFSWRPGRIEELPGVAFGMAQLAKDLWPRQPRPVARRRRGSFCPTIRANFGIWRRSLATIRSDIAGPMPGSEARNFTSCSSMAVATSLTGCTIDRRAFFTPTPSTEQNNSKNSRSTSLRKPIKRGVMRPCMGLPSRYSIVCKVICLPIPAASFAA